MVKAMQQLSSGLPDDRLTPPHAAGRLWRQTFVGLCLGACLSTTTGLALGDATVTTLNGGAVGAEILKSVGLFGTSDLGSGVTLKLGVLVDQGSLASGADTLSLNGAKLAVAQIKAAGGPDIQLIVETTKSTDDRTVTHALDDLAAVGAPVVLTGGVGDTPQMLDGLARNTMLGLDGEGRVSSASRGKDLLWTLRAQQPDDDFSGAVQYLATFTPSIKKVSLVYRDKGATANDATLASFAEALKFEGMTLASAGLVPLTGSDYSVILGRLKLAQPDAVFVDETGADLNQFIHQFRVAQPGLTLIGGDYPPGAGRGATGDFENYVFATDWFDAAHPGNNWAALFVRTYQTAYGQPPETFAANAYEDTFAIWALLRHLTAKGKALKTGLDLQSELVANHGLKSLYGGDGAELDDIQLDTKAHRVVERPFGVFRVNGGKVSQLARFDLGGANFELLP